MFLDDIKYNIAVTVVKDPMVETFIWPHNGELLLTWEILKTIVNYIWPFRTRIFSSLVYDLHLEYLSFVFGLKQKYPFPIIKG